MLVMKLGAMTNGMGYMGYGNLLDVSHVVILITLMLSKMYVL
jgi:hypothetical protein